MTTFLASIPYQLLSMAVSEMHHIVCAGAVCNCILPESLKIDAVRHDPDGQAEDSEKRRLTGAFSCFSSISLCQRHFSTSSLFLRSPAKGTSWDNNSRVLPNWRRAENWGTLYIAFPYWSTKIFLSAISSTTVIKEGYKGIYKVSCMSEHWLQLCFEICTECVEVILKLEFPVQWAQSPKIFQWWLLSMPTLPSDILLVAASKLTLFNVCSVERVFYL